MTKRRQGLFALGLTGLGLGLVWAVAGDGGLPVERSLAGPPSGGLVYVRPENGRTDLWRARLSDGAVRPLLRTPVREEAWPFWSSIAGRLVFEASRAGSEKRTQLVLFDPRRNQESRIPAPPTWSEGWAAWSPVDARLAFAFSSRRGQQPPAGIAVVDVLSGARALYARSGPRSLFFRPEFSPDGRQLVAQRRDAGGASTIWLLDPEQKEPARALAGGAEFHASKARFLRDGERIVFTRERSGDGVADVALVRPDGSDLRLVGSLPEAHDHTARGSPTRDEVAYISDRDGQFDLFLLDLESGEARNLTRAIQLEVNGPRWSPDGERIALVGGRDGDGGVEESAGDGERLFVVVIDRSGARLLETPGYSPDWMPAWP